MNIRPLQATLTSHTLILLLSVSHILHLLSLLHLCVPHFFLCKVDSTKESRSETVAIIFHILYSGSRCIQKSVLDTTDILSFFHMPYLCVFHILWPCLLMHVVFYPFVPQVLAIYSVLSSHFFPHTFQL